MLTLEEEANGYLSSPSSSPSQNLALEEGLHCRHVVLKKKKGGFLFSISRFWSLGFKVLGNESLKAIKLATESEVEDLVKCEEEKYQLDDTTGSRPEVNFQKKIPEFGMLA